MPVATTPYQQNDYQAVSQYRPYRLPVNDIFKSIASQDLFWKKGAERVQNMYENALNLKLSLEPNIEIRDNFMKEADKQLTKLAAMDLSDPSVQRQGLNIYMPLLKDEGIISDDAATRHIEKINNDALRFRDEDNGKYYSVTNHKYALTGANEFRNSTDRMAGKKYLAQAKEYEPYYDPSSELSDILKNCKPDKLEKDYQSGFYISHISEESLTAKKINTCIDGGLSDKARRQLQINGTVAYQGQPEALANVYVPHLQGVRRGLTEIMAAMEGILINRNNLKNLKKDDLEKIGIKSADEITPEMLKIMDEQYRTTQKRLSNLDETIKQISNGNLQSITDNFEQIAGSMFAKDYMENVAEGFAYNFSSNTLKPDAAQMMIYQQAQMNARQEDDQEHDKEMMQMRFDHEDAVEKRKNGILSGLFGQNEFDLARSMNALGASPFSAIEPSGSYDAVVQKRQEIVADREKTNKWLYEQIGIPKEYITDANGNFRWSSEAKNYYDNYKISAKNDPVKQQIINQYDTRMGGLVMEEDLYRGTQNIVDERMKPRLKDFQNDVNKIHPITIKLQDGSTVNINSNDIYNMFYGSGNLKQSTINQGSLGINNISPTINASVGNSEMKEYTYGGKRLAVGQNEEFQKVMFKLQNKFSKFTKDFRNERDALMNQETVMQRESYMFKELNDDDKAFKQTLLPRIGVDKKYTGKIVVQDTDGKGNLIVKVNPPTKSETDFNQEETIKNLLKYNAGDNIRINEEGKPDANGSRVIIRGINFLSFVNDKGFDSKILPYVRMLETRTQTGNTQSTPYLRGMSANYKLVISEGLGGGFTYKILSEEDPNSPVLVSDDRDKAVQQFKFYLERK